MTELAQKIADGLRKSGLVSEMDMGAVLDAIRSALPVAQGEVDLIQRIAEAGIAFIDSEGDGAVKVKDLPRYAALPASAPEAQGDAVDDKVYRHNSVTRHEKWREMVSSARAAVEDFTDMPDDRAIIHADALIRNLEADCLHLSSERDAFLRAAAPPASRIAELEREVERLREALTYYAENKHWYEGMSSQPVLREHGDKARKALAAQEKNDE